MIQHINSRKTFLILFILFSFIRCKDSTDSKKSISNDIGNDSIIKNGISDTNESLNGSIIKNDDIVNWVFYKVVPLSDAYNCDISKYERFKFSISNDSIFIDNLYTDDVYRGVNKSKTYFPQKYLYNLYKDFLPKNFNVDLPDEIDNIRNKNVYNKKSKLDSYFQDAFFINDYIFFENNGCLYCFLKETINTIKLSNNYIVTSDFKLPYDKKININSIKYNILECKLISGVDKFLCDEVSLRYIPLPKFQNVSVILVPQDCADFSYRYYLLTIFNNKVVSSEYVEGEWYEPGDDSYKEITNFSIDENYNITIKTKEVENGKSSLKEESKFKISNIGKLEKIK